MSYARSLAEEVICGRLDLHNLAESDETAIAELVRVKGIGRWSAEVYLLFAEGREDVWPAGDIVVQSQVGSLLTLTANPCVRRARTLAYACRPHPTSKSDEQ